MDRWRTRDGEWTVETVTLAGTPDNRDGSWLRVRRLGYYVADVRDAAGMACYIDLRELEEVEHDSGTDLAGQSDPDTGRHLGGGPAWGTGWYLGSYPAA
jgi:hypothetical protein